MSLENNNLTIEFENIDFDSINRNLFKFSLSDPGSEVNCNCNCGPNNCNCNGGSTKICPITKKECTYKSCVTCKDNPVNCNNFCSSGNCNCNCGQSNCNCFC